MKCTLLTSPGGLGLGVGRFLARGAENGKNKRNLINKGQNHNKKCSKSV